MNKVFRIAAAILILALAVYLMVTLFFVFLVLAGIGLVYILFMRFFGKSPKTSAHEPSDGIVIEHEPLDTDKNDRKGSE